MSDSVGPVISVGLTAYLLAFAFTGVNVYPASVKYAEVECASNGGWKSIKEVKLGDGVLTCNNGAKFTYDPEKLEKPNE